MKTNQAPVTSGNPKGLLQSPMKHIHRILVVEDDIDIRETNTELLMRFGYQVEKFWPTVDKPKPSKLMLSDSMAPHRGYPRADEPV
jgi:hypothetical protein